MPALKKIEELIVEGRYDQAQAELAAASGQEQDQADLAFCRGLLHQSTGNWAEAIDAYQEALAANDQHVEATFHLAYLLDLHGEEEQAIELYEHCVADPPLHVNALINLAVLHEDAGRYDDAARCLEAILEEHPNHARARLFLKDVESAKTMFYDEDLERVLEKRNAILDIPVSDFELSVRARNCLKQMDIDTLGDLLRITEVQLMGYKNFGETSLCEIKAMLTQKGLHLGQLLEEEAEETQAAQVPSLGESGVYGRAVSELELSVRARKCLQRLGVATIGELAAKSEPELLSIKNFGQTSLHEIKRRLSELGLSLRSSS
jgi:DNA-directed RNA polymerase subunit alpha